MKPQHVIVVEVVSVDFGAATEEFIEGPLINFGRLHRASSCGVSYKLLGLISQRHSFRIDHNLYTGVFSHRCNIRTLLSYLKGAQSFCGISLLASSRRA